MVFLINERVVCMSDTIIERRTLESHFEEPLETAVAVMRDSLDEYQSKFITLSPFACIATANTQGQPTISPKGDAPGFVRIIDERTLLVPDRKGNNKVESFHNLVENPGIALIFMIPGIRETLRVSGRAVITTDQALLDGSRVGKATVRTGLHIHIDKVYFHCGKAMIRSKLWEEEYRLSRGDLPSFGEILRVEAGLDSTTEEFDAYLEEAYRNQLY